ncbi:MAG: BolA/IbaG family iron-sulfur metabolism protein [Deltaproteobacteria bacterium]|nr:BolA/IbaG family iron-sulfur metabolism protein [Deltaproteobacteria bacterium]
MTPDEIRESIEQALSGAQVEVRDLTGTGDHYHAVVGYAGFAEKGLIQQHQMVYGALGGKVGGEIHALMLKTCLPEEFEAAVAAEAE